MAVLVGCFLVALNLAGYHFQRKDNLPGFIIVALGQGIAYPVGARIVLRNKPVPGALGIVLVFAVIPRDDRFYSCLSFQRLFPLLLGRPRARGWDQPLSLRPGGSALEGLRDKSIFPYINSADYAQTVPPSVAEAILFAATRVSQSVSWMRIVMVGLEGIAIIVLMNLLATFHLPRVRFPLYAWHPLATWEFPVSYFRAAVDLVIGRSPGSETWSRHSDLPWSARGIREWNLLSQCRVAPS